MFKVNNNNNTAHILKCRTYSFTTVIMHREFTLPFGSAYGNGAIWSLYKKYDFLLRTYPFSGKVGAKLRVLTTSKYKPARLYYLPSFLPSRRRYSPGWALASLGFRNNYFLQGEVVSLTPNPQPRGPGYPLLSGPSPSTCPARVALPVADATAGIALRVI